MAYNTDPPRWGAEVRGKDTPQVAHFKLGLQENVRDHYKNSGGKGSEMALGGYLTNHQWRHPDLQSKTPLDFTCDYLKNVNNYVLNSVLPAHFGEDFLQNQQISYVLTVPAIWSDKAKELTRQAALKAGIQGRKLMLITEPEPATLYCATLCSETSLGEGDRFLVCDAGGGTVVSPVSAPCSRTPFPHHNSRIL